MEVLLLSRLLKANEKDILKGTNNFSIPSSWI
jgi:hypothetical protein